MIYTYKPMRGRSQLVADSVDELQDLAGKLHGRVRVDQGSIARATVTADQHRRSVELGAKVLSIRQMQRKIRELEAGLHLRCVKARGKIAESTMAAKAWVAKSEEEVDA